MSKFYFTYGSEGHPFEGGWTEVHAPDVHAAVAAFQIFHPNKVPNLLNCCAIYTEEEFNATKMAGPGGNFGAFCHETIDLEHEID